MKQNAVIVFITNQRECERLIKAGSLLASADTLLKAVSVEPRQAQGRPTGAALEHLYQICVSLGASMTILYEDALPAQAAVRYMKKFNVSHIVTGVPDTIREGNFAYEIHKAMPKTALSVVTPSGEWRAFASLTAGGSVHFETAGTI